MTTYSMNRRSVLGLVSFAAFNLAGCTKQSAGAEEIHFGREACTMCGMIISDAHFATEVRNAQDKTLVKFDDFGCALNWLKSANWDDAAIGEFWVMDSDDGTTWLDARTANYVSGIVTPMNYGYAAVKEARTGTVPFAAAKAKLIAMGPSNYCNSAKDNEA